MRVYCTVVRAEAADIYSHRWSPGKNPNHTVHVEDVAGGMWACAVWMAGIGRKEADSIAGEEILFRNDKSKAKQVEGMVAPDRKCIAPLFNIVSGYVQIDSFLLTEVRNYVGRRQLRHHGGTGQHHNIFLRYYV